MPAGLPPAPKSSGATSPSTVSGRPPNSPILVRLPSSLIRQPATAPEPGRTLYRNRPSGLTRMSSGVEPCGLPGGPGQVVGGAGDGLEQRQAAVVADAVARDRARPVVGAVGEPPVVLDPARIELGVGHDRRDRR